MRCGLLVVLVAACGSPHAPRAGDATDAANDAPRDAPPDDGCKHRTLPAGTPEGNYPPSSILMGDVTIRSQADVDALAASA